MLRVTRTDRQPHADLGIMGGGDVPVLVPEIQRVIALSSNAVDPPLDRRQRFSTSCPLAAGGAGTLTAFQLFNPANSGVIVYCDQIEADFPVAGRASYGVQATALPTLRFQGAQHFLDIGVTSAIRTSRAEVRSDYPVAGLLSLHAKRMAANISTTLFPPGVRYRLNPGSGIHVQMVDAPNAVGNVEFWWLEVLREFLP